MIWLIVLLAVLAGCVGYATGSLSTLLYGSAAAVKMAHHRLDEDEPPQPDPADDDEESRLDALTIRDLMRVGARVFNGSKDLVITVEARKELAIALDQAQERFADWIEWAEGATKTKTALAAPERDRAAV